MIAGAKTFLDSNLFLYSTDTRDQAKQNLANDLILEVGRHGGGVISTQVMQEVFSVAVGKLAMPAGKAKEFVRQMSLFEVVQVSPAIIERAMDCVVLHALSFWDALIVCAAAAAHCRLLLSEDMQHGQQLLGVRIENPFL